MAEDLFAYQLNHPLPPETQPLYSVRPPSSSRKGKHSKKRHGRRQDSNEGSNDNLENTNNDNSKSDATNNFDYLFSNYNDNKTNTTNNVHANKAKPTKKSIYTINNGVE